MNTMTAAKAHLDSIAGEEREHLYLQVANTGTILVTLIGHGAYAPRLRVWSEDKEGHLAVAVADQWGCDTGAARFEISTQSAFAIGAMIDAALATLRASY